MIVTTVTVHLSSYCLQDHPWGLVGYTWRDISDRAGRLGYELFVKTRYSLVLTNAAFIHREYLKIYTESLPASASKLISRYFNCEDIAMNYVISDHCRCSAVYRVKPEHFKLLQTVGIAQRKGHIGKRDICLTEFAKTYGRRPLSKPTTCVW